MNKPEREIATVQKLMMIRKSEIDYRTHFDSLGIKRPAAVYLTKILESGESEKIQRFKKLWQEMVEEKLTNHSAPKEQNEPDFEGQFVYIKVISNNNLFGFYQIFTCNNVKSFSPLIEFSA